MLNSQDGDDADNDDDNYYTTTGNWGYQVLENLGKVLEYYCFTDVGTSFGSLDSTAS